MAKSGYDEFREIAKRFKSVSVATVGAGGTVPFVAYLAGIAPPWPPGVLGLTALSQLVCLILAYQFARGRSKQVIDRTMVILVLFLVVFAIVYLSIFATFTFPTPGNTGRALKGLICQDSVAKMYPSCPFLGIDVLQLAEYHAPYVWKEWSIAGIGVILVACWLMSIACLAGFVGIFLVHQSNTFYRREKVPIRKQSSRKGTMGGS
jgi:hypothetical protein